MKSFVWLMLFCACSITGISQGTVSSRQLTQEQIDSIFTDQILDSLHVEFSVYRIYEYSDKSGLHYIVMTENRSYKPNEAFKKEVTDVYHDSIKAYCYDSLFNLRWQITDFIIDENEWSEEYSISFWTKYFELEDYNDDGYVDPILIYGTFGTNGTGDGRIKILTYYKGSKFAIRHQNGSLDFQRNTRVDEQFYDLPTGIQDRVKELMVEIMDNGHGIFPAGWEDAMQNEELSFDENN